MAIEAGIARLVERARSGDREAFLILYDRYRGYVEGLALDAPGGRSQAQDLAQEVWLHAWRSLPSLRDPEAFPAWLGQIQRNLAVGRLRDAVRRKMAGERTDAGGEPTAASPGASDPDEASREVSEILHRLPEVLRTATAMRYLDGLTYGQIAGRLGVPVSTVRGRLYEAHRKFAELRRNLGRGR